MRGFRIKELEHIWITGLRTDDRPALGAEKEKIGQGAVRNNMGAEKFELLMAHCLRNYDAGGREVAFHFDNATCRSRRHEHWVNEVEVTEGGRIRRGCDQRLGGWGVEKCKNSLTGSEKNTSDVVDRERCDRSLRARGEEPTQDLSLIEMGREK